jgi:hypothetical protein
MTLKEVTCLASLEDSSPGERIKIIGGRCDCKFQPTCEFAEDTEAQVEATTAQAS